MGQGKNTGGHPGNAISIKNGHSKINATQVGYNPQLGTGYDPSKLDTGIPDGVFLGLVVGATVGSFIIIVTLMSLIIRRLCGNKREEKHGKKRLLNMHFDESMNLTVSKSAPSTRASSPNTQKKNKDNLKPNMGPLVRSLTVDTIPDMTDIYDMPTEKVQPGEEKTGDGMTQYMHNLVSHLQADLYRSSTDDEDDSVGSAGQIWFSLFHDPTTAQLTISLYKARINRGRGKSNQLRDPYVKIYLLPDEKTCQHSKVIRKTLVPVFNQVFYFRLTEAEVRDKTIRFSMYDVDKRRVRHSLGHVFVPLAEVDLTKDDVYIKDLEVTSQASPSLGELAVSLTYLPTQEKLRVGVCKAQKLTKIDIDGDEMLYAKVQLIYGHRAHKTRKTPLQPAVYDPDFKAEMFGFNVPCKQLESCSVRIAIVVASAGYITGSEMEYGRVTLGSYMFARGEELLHWQEMCANSKMTITRWHSLHTPKSRSRHNSGNRSN